MTAKYYVRVGDCLESMKRLPDGCINTCITSPPYFGLRDYGQDGQIGLEATPDEFVAALVAVLREVRRVLRDDGTLWLNLGDSYASQPSWGRGGGSTLDGRKQGGEGGKSNDRTKMPGLKQKDLIGIPWRVAFALQADGWYLRQDIIWHKPNPMPESVRDRCTKSHEYVFLLSKSPKYYYDHEAVKEPATTSERDIRRAKITGRGDQGSSAAYMGSAQRDKSGGFPQKDPDNPTRNRRSVWTVNSRPYKGAHFATFPPDLIEPCILAGCPEGGTVLDPFGGCGTTAGVSVANNRNAVMCELSPEYAQLIPERVDWIKSYYAKKGAHQ